MANDNKVLKAYELAKETYKDFGVDTDKAIDELSKKISDYEYMTGEHRKKVLDTFKDLSDMRQNMGSLSAQKELLKEVHRMIPRVKRSRIPYDEGKLEEIKSLVEEEKMDNYRIVAAAETILLPFGCA